MFLKINEEWTINLDEVVAMKYTDNGEAGSEIRIHLADSRQLNISFDDDSAGVLKELISESENLDHVGDRAKMHCESRICEIFATGTVQVLPP